VKVVLAVTTLALTGISGLVSAAPVSILNPSFESANLPLVGNGTFSQLIAGSTIFASGGTLDGWMAGANTSNSAAGGFAPSPGGNNWTSSWWQGSNVAYVQLSGPGVVSLGQALPDTLQNDTMYTLTVDVGRRIFTPNFSYEIQLYAGTTLVASASNLTLASNSFGTDAAVYSSGSNNALAGQNLGIVLTAFTNGATFTEAFFDNVRLDAVSASAIPEPGTIGLVLSGLAVATLRRFKRPI
jgi:hypothetical protein